MLRKYKKLYHCISFYANNPCLAICQYRPCLISYEYIHEYKRYVKKDGRLGAMLTQFKKSGRKTLLLTNRYPILDLLPK